MNNDFENILKQLQINAAAQQEQNSLKKTELKNNSSKNGLQKGWTRTTFIIKEEHALKLKEIAYWERITLKQLVEEALTTFLNTKASQTVPQKNNF